MRFSKNAIIVILGIIIAAAIFIMPAAADSKIPADPKFKLDFTVSASVEKQNGNTNKLYIALKDSKGIVVESGTFEIKNNADGVYTLKNGYKVYVGTYGNTKISGCFVIEKPTQKPAPKPDPKPVKPTPKPEKKPEPKHEYEHKSKHEYERESEHKNYPVKTAPPTTAPKPPAAVLPTSVSIGRTQVSLILGEVLRLTAVVKPDNASSKVVVWSSSNKNVATVSNAGTVRTMSIGKTTITAKTSNGLTASCEVTVTD